MLCNLASGEHVGLGLSKDDLSCLRLDISDALSQVLRLRTMGDEAEPEGTTANFDVEAIRLSPGSENRLGFHCMLACPPVVLGPPIVLCQGNEIGTCIEEMLVTPLAFGAKSGQSCGLLLVAVCNDCPEQCSDNGNSGRDDPRHNAQPIT